jgi:class 3 adenylate cyclase/YHS domain-containing protein
VHADHAPTEDSREATFVFADIAGFTALTEAHGDAEAADVAEAFAAEVRTRLDAYHAELVKTIGDALMLRTPDASAAVRLGLFLAHDLGRSHGAPQVRVGMHHGTAVHRDGDWFGSTVNTAARISGAAVGGEVLLSAAVRDRAGEIPGVRFAARGAQVLRNLREPVVLFAALGAAETGERLEVDPVCRMAVEPGMCAGALLHDGVEYHFCSLACAARFAADPASYAITADGS